MLGCEAIVDRCAAKANFRVMMGRGSGLGTGRFSPAANYAAEYVMDPYLGTGMQNWGSLQKKRLLGTILGLASGLCAGILFRRDGKALRGIPLGRVNRMICSVILFLQHRGFAWQ